MSGVYLAPSLAVLRAEINTRWPNRDHTSDGWIGDAAHQATKSDHNPNARGSVDAIDVDEDGVDFATVFAAIRRHPSARYVIYERKLYHRLRGWRPEPYSGVNPHDHHFHISIDQTQAAEQDRRPWGLLEDDMTEAEVIAAVQKALTSPLPLPGKVGARLNALGWAPNMSPWEAQARTVEWVITGAPALSGLDDGEITALAAAIADRWPADQAKRLADELAARLAS